ncbi:MAG: hypothetical protein ABIE68_01245 [bacterium]
MFSTSHAAVGTVIGAATGNPILAFIFGIIFHFIFDLLPHGNEEMEFSDKNKLISILLQGLVDAYILIFIILFTSTFNVIEYSDAMFWGIIGSIFPDLITGAIFLFKTKNWKISILEKFWDFHSNIQNVLPQGSFITGLTIQLFVFILAYGVLFAYYI